MLILSLLFLTAVIVAIFFYWNKNRAPINNQYRKVTKTRVQPRLNSEDDFSNDNTDETLGLTFSAKSPESVVNTPPKKSVDHTQTDCVVALYLMAPENSPYVGYELLQALLSAGMRFGDKRIFHRYTYKDGRGDVLFHCASAVSPGTFDLTKMGAFSCKGLCLFFEASAVEDPLATFDCLLETIDQLVEDLGGQVLDEKRALFTKDRMVKYRQQIRLFEAGRTTADMFA